VFTKEPSYVWGALVPMWTTCTFEDFLHQGQLRPFILWLY